MYFFNNTFYSSVSGAAGRNFIFQISFPTIVIEAWNNIFYLVGNVELDWTQAAGTINFRGANTIYRSGGTLLERQYDTAATNVSINYLGTVSSADPEFLSVDVASRDLALRETSPSLNIGTATPSGIPAGFDLEHPLLFQPMTKANGSIVRSTVGAGIEVGAFEYDPSAPPTSSPVSVGIPVVTPASAAIGDLLTASNGNWLHMSAGTYAYQWQRNIAGTWTDIAGFTTNTFTTVDPGDHRVKITATNAVGPTVSYSDLSVVSTVAIVAPTIRTAISTTAAYSSSTGVGGEGTFNTLTTPTNLIMFVVDSADSAQAMNAGHIFDNVGNVGVWTQAGSLTIGGGTKARRVQVYYKLGAVGRAGHVINIYAGTDSYTSTFVLEIPGNITVGAPVLTNTTSSPYVSDNITLSGDAMLLAFAGTMLAVGGSYTWGGGFVKVPGAQITTGTDSARTAGTVATRLATTGSYSAFLTMPTGAPTIDVGMIVIPVSFA
jgi:hypothetical protein